MQKTNTGPAVIVEDTSSGVGIQTKSALEALDLQDAFSHIKL